jgi:hypothetical protein
MIVKAPRIHFVCHQYKPLFKIVTGRDVPYDVRDDLVDCRKIGKMFRQEKRLNRTRTIYDMTQTSEVCHQDVELAQADDNVAIEYNFITLYTASPVWPRIIAYDEVLLLTSMATCWDCFRVWATISSLVGGKLMFSTYPISSLCNGSCVIWDVHPSHIGTPDLQTDLSSNTGPYREIVLGIVVHLSL